MQSIQSDVSDVERGEAAPGLVPYTTSHRTSTRYELQEKVRLVSSLDSRLARMKHHVRTAGRLVRETMKRGGRKWRAVFVTLTYAPDRHWSPKHIAAFLTNVREWCRYRGAKPGYVWVAEMQKRGAVHYHAVIWIPAALSLPRPDKRGWWPHGSTNVQAVKRNAVGYVMKYVSKGAKGDRAPDLPKGARVCGSGGLDEMGRAAFSFWRWPRYVREAIQADWDIGPCRPVKMRRVLGGGWIRERDGEHVGPVVRTDWGLFGIGFRSRERDCNGRVRRAEAVSMLSDEYKRELGVQRDADPLFVERVREEWYEAWKRAEDARCCNRYESRLVFLSGEGRGEFYAVA